MNAKTRILVTLGAVVLTFGLFSLEQPASAQSTNNCMKVKGNWVDIYTGSGTTDIGTITNAGILNGTAETIYGIDFFPTSDPNIVSFFADSTLTTNRGVLVTHNVYVGFIDVGGGPLAPGVFTALYRIDSVASTGIFAGATGFLNMFAKVTNFGSTVNFDMTGEICFANR